MRFYIFLFFTVVTLLTAPITTASLIYAAEDTSGFVTCSGADECNFCSFVDMTNNIIEWAIVIATSFVVLLIAFAGFRLLTAGGDASALENAKKLLINTFIGILIMLAGWTVVDTFLKVIAGGDLGVWNVVECGGAYGSSPAAEIDITLNSYDGIDYTVVESFVADHGEGSVLEGPTVVMVGGGGNCPGASGSEVVKIPGEGNNALRPDVARNFVAMRAAAAADGIRLSVSSAWRSQASQEEIWRRHKCDAVGCSGTVARPCSKGGSGSNHNGGVAVDINGSSPRDTAIYNWLKKNGGRYGFYNNLGPRDPVHWSPTGR